SIGTPGDPFYGGQSSTYTPPGTSGYSYPGQPTSSPTGVSPGWTPMLPNSPTSPQQTLPTPPAGTNWYRPQPGSAPGTTTTPGGGMPASSPAPGVGGVYTPSAFGAQPPSRITIPTGSGIPSGNVGSSVSNAPSATGTPSAGGVPAGSPSAPPNQPTQPIIRTLEPRANSQPGIHLASSAGGPTAGGVPPSGGMPVSRAAPPPTGNSSPMATSGGTGPVGSIDLASLPPSRSPSGPPPANPSSSASGGATGAVVGGGNSSASGTAGGNVSGAPGTASSSNPYGFDPQYQWLRGVLCYSAAEGCWRLRYVPPGCTGDRLGGWVILCHPSGLAGFCSGEQVEVRGQLIYKQTGACQLPIYQVQDIRRTRA
ncbi:MAG TPA: hypothetical protein PK777_08635, partial [Thermoguttaceae bacterium]|nr:hypothetical protein [Thermoguttaceae bacterium]